MPAAMAPFRDIQDQRCARTAAEVWIACTHHELGKTARRWLDDAERARLERFVLEAERQRRLTAWCLRRHVLSSFRPDVDPRAWRFDHSPTGKPRLAPPFDHLQIEHSLSHAGHYAACMVAPEPCGVDVELLRDGIATLSDALTPDEQEDVRRSARPDDRFLCRWVVKEAVLKMFGVGLACPPRSVRVALAPGGEPAGVTLASPLPSGFVRNLRVAAWLLPDGHRLAAACDAPAGAPPPVLREWLPA